MENRSRIRFDLDFVLTLSLVALTLTLGLQMMRVLFPTITWYLRDSVGLSSITLAYYAFPVFLTGFLAAALYRAVGPRLAIWITAGGLAVLRVAEQIIIEPGIDLWVSAAGTTALLLFLPISLAHARARHEPQSTTYWGAGLLLGLALDSAIKGLTRTLDLSWMSGWLPLLAVTAFSALLLWIVWRQPSPRTDTAPDLHGPDALPMAAIGPFLFLQAIVYQNQGWLAEVGKLEPRSAFALLMLGNVLAVVGLTWGLARPNLMRPIVALLAGITVLTAAATADLSGAWFPVIVLLSQFVMGWGWAFLMTVASKPGRTGLARTTAAFASGMMVFLILSFAYYVSLDLKLPLPRSAWLPAGSVLLATGWLLASMRMVAVRMRAFQGRAPIAIAALLFIVPVLVIAIRHRPPDLSDPEGQTVRIMTYNIHSAFNRAGRQDPETVARVIESSEADVIGLQEVSRGWLINGSTDLVTWLSYRLGMQVHFQGTGDPVWGNALLSRYPILEFGHSDLPGEGTLIGRGYLWARIDAGMPEALLLINTHLHQVEVEPEPRIRQVQAILDFWDGRTNTFVIGDLNARPGTEEMELFTRAGFTDSWAEAGDGAGLTYISSDPFQRIDWIWHTPSLTARAVEVPSTTASDHLPVVGTFE